MIPVKNKCLYKHDKKNRYLFFDQYKKNFISCISKVNLKKIVAISDELEKIIKKKKRIFVAGNGGSAAVANHFLCDFNKGVKLSSGKKIIPRVISLSNSIELITAISNDISYEEVFKSQVENYIEPGDCLFLMSCSGKSKNIVKLINYYKNKKVKIILLTGFLKKSSKIKVNHHINVDFQNYGITEDIFSSIMHMISQYLRFKFSTKKEIL